MPRALSLRTDYTASKLRILARSSKYASQVRRLLSLAAIYDGASRGEAARLTGTDRKIVRDWVERFNQGGPEALKDRYVGRNFSVVTPEMRQALAKRSCH